MIERPEDGDQPEKSGLPSPRISDSDRNQVIELLRHHTGEGLLTLDEFGDRVALVFDAGTRSDLEAVLDDLPRVAQDVPEARRRKVTRWVPAILSGAPIKGRIRLADTTNVVAIMGGAELDLRNAEIDGTEVEINCLAIMGGIEIIVPEGIEVDWTPIPLLGGAECKINSDVPIIPGSPRLVIRALSIMGGVSVKSKPSVERSKELKDQRRADRELRRADEHRRRAERHTRRTALPGLPELPMPAAPGAPAAPGNRGARAGRPPSPRSRTRDRDWLGDLGPAIERVAQAVQDEWPALRSRAAPDGTVTIMFSDIEGYTLMTERLGDHKSQEILRRHNELVRKALAEHGGFEVKSQGDGFMVAFGGASRGLRCAAAIQHALGSYNSRHPDEPIRVRMGLHTGEAIKEQDDFLGRCVIVASRIANEAEGGEILVSSVLRELTAATGEFTFADQREVALKGMSDPQTVYSLVWE